ncbi:MAG: copper amine oxidase N-terminal domain-containing protein [Anaerotignum sp.]|nr:copper amine oxidase N-terminal domain-containing protein [Anaerotignum sp.]
MRKFVAVLLTGIMALTCFGTAFAAETKVTVDGVSVAFTDAKPFVDENGRTLVPLRPIANALGMEVAWDAQNQVAAFTEYYSLGVYNEVGEYEGELIVAEPLSLTVKFQIGSETLVGSGNVKMEDGTEVVVEESLEMDTAPVVKDGRTYAPLRYLAESFGYDVGWDSTTFTVAIADNRF